MAHITRRKTAAGEPRYVVKYRAPAGRQREKWFRTLVEARRYATTASADVISGRWVDPRAGRVTLEEYANRWLAQRPMLRPRTCETYEAQLRLHVIPSLGGIELAKLTPAHVREWHSGLIAGGVSPNMAAKCYRLLRTMMGTACADELIVRNPCVVKGAGLEHTAERPVATAAEVWEVADAIVERFRCLVLLAGFVGLRVGELLGLERRHVNLLHGTITVEQQEQQLRGGELILGPPKTEAGVRTLALPPFLARELDTHLAAYAAPGSHGRVFCGERGGPLRRHVLQKHWSYARAKAGLPEGFRMHDLRHTANTLTASSGASLKEQMYRMGHASAEAALRYQHATRDRDVAVAKALDDLATAASPRRPDDVLRALDASA
jgi:integrase